jgi:hypothetical protein
MNDDQQVQNQRSIQAPQAIPTAQKIVDQPPVATPTPSPFPPASPTSVPTKEHAPIPTVDVQVQEVTKGPEISQELKEAGVEEGADAKEHELPEEVKKAGVMPAKESTPVVSGAMPAQVLTLPMTYEEAILEEKKEKSPKNARSWKIKEILRELKKQLLAKLTAN